MRIVAFALAALAAAPASTRDPVPAPGLNHVYVVLDQASFDAIRQSTALAKRLGPSDGGLPDYAPPRADADRIFFRGRQTYLELFAPNNRFGEPVGKVGLALGEDRPDRFDALERRWRALCGAGTRRSTVSYTRIQPAVPWYESLQCDETAAGPALAVWAMTYRPEFHRWQVPAATGAPQTSRHAILAPRAAAGQGRFDITALTIDVAPQVAARLIPQMVAAGLKRRDTAAGTRLRGDGWELVLRQTDAIPGSIAIAFASRKPSSSGSARFDLRLEGGHAANMVR